MLVPILAVEALLKATGALPVNVKFFFEGQEEIGSPQLGEFVPRHKELLACDMVLSSDGGQWSETEPLILVGLRGVCGVQIDGRRRPTPTCTRACTAAWCRTRIHALANSSPRCTTPTGRVTVAGFYDDVLPLTRAGPRADRRGALRRVGRDREPGGAGALRRGRLHRPRADLGRGRRWR